MKCPSCHGDSQESEVFQDIQIYACEDCKNRFGFIKDVEQELEGAA